MATPVTKIRSGESAGGSKNDDQGGEKTGGKGKKEGNAGGKPPRGGKT